MKKNNLPYLFLGLFLSISLTACNEAKEKNYEEAAEASTTKSEEPFFKISLAQWSLNEPFESGEIDPMDFPEMARERGFEGVEYVSQLYMKKYVNAEDPKAAFQAMLDTLKAKSQEFKLQNVLIMVDEEGDLS